MHRQQSPSHQRKEAEVVEEEGAAAGEVAAAEEAVETAMAVPEEAAEAERRTGRRSSPFRFESCVGQLES